MNVIDIKSLTKSYGKSRGIKNINLQVKEGEVFGFVGPNGAGKSTTIRTLLNFIFPTSGEAKIFGKDIVKDSKEVKKFIGYVPSEVKFYENIKVKEIINYSASFYDNCNKDEIEELCKRFDIEEDKKMGELSLGNKKKVAIVQALIHKPKLLILDEPTNGLDPLIQKRLFELILEQKEKGVTIFFSSHNLVEVEHLCDRVAVIRDGEIVDVIDVKKDIRKAGVKVIIKGDNITKEYLESIGGEVISKDGVEFTFKYLQSIDKLIKELANINIEKLLINEETLEESFMNYYSEEGDN